MCELVNADTHTKTAVALQKIKSELNPYGRGVSFEARYLTKKERFRGSSPVNQDYYLKDSHIWKALSLYELRPNEQHLQILLLQLEFLIKYDWERSKSEVKSETKWFALSIVFSLVGIACFVLAEWSHMSLVGHAEINKLLNLSICGLGVIIIPYLSFSYNLPRWIFVADSVLWIILAGWLAISYYVSGNNLCYLLSLTFFGAGLILSLEVTTTGRAMQRKRYTQYLSGYWDAYEESQQSRTDPSPLDET